MKVSFTDDANNEETLTSAPTATVAARPNSPATGAPTITGTAQVGETLSADTSGISDSDGLINVSYSYQWVSNDGKHRHGHPGRHGFHLHPDRRRRRQDHRGAGVLHRRRQQQRNLDQRCDGDGGRQTQLSRATGAPTIGGTPQVDQTLTADTSGITDADGLTNVSYSYQWIRSDNGTDADIGGQTASTYTLADSDEGKAIKVKVSFTDDANNEETLTSAATGVVAAKPNSPATGAPTIDGTAQVGETLTALTNGITDENGLDDVSYSYQWVFQRRNQ